MSPAIRSARVFTHLHSGRTSEATRLLDTARPSSRGTPGVYYFHSIALRRQGRSGEADAMLEQGAMVEAQFSGSRFAIDQSLERIQGATRLKIEAARRDARAAYAESRQTRQAARVAARDARQALVQRQPGRVPLEAFTRPVSLDQARVIAADHSDPFADDAGRGGDRVDDLRQMSTQSSFFEPARRRSRCRSTTMRATRSRIVGTPSTRPTDRAQPILRTPK